MKTILIIFFTVFLLHPSMGQETFTNKIPTEAGQTLKMELSSGGSINIYTWSEPSVEAKIQILKCKGGDCEASLEAKSYGGLLKSRVIHPRGNSTSVSINIDVWIPSDYNVEITSAGGAINATGINGSLSGSCGGGHLKIIDMTGNVAFSTGGGGITIDRGRLNARINTGGGSIEVKNAYVTGRLNTGGGSIKASGIYILPDEAGQSSDGKFAVNTGAGNIQVALARDANPELMDMILSTGTGKVSLEIPQSMNPSVDVQMAYTRNFPRQEISSDLNLQTEETQEWDDRNGTPRKYVFGKSINGNPRQHITIRNINGDVVIRKF